MSFIATRLVAALAALLLLAPAGHAVEERTDLARHFTAAGVTGTFVLLDGQTGRSLTSDLDRARTGFLPGSTFKIPNSLIALETGVSSGPDFRLEWDPAVAPREPWWPASWAGPQTMRSALRDSVIWYYQELARRIGHRRMQAYVNRFSYGNRDISGGIDQFWLTGGLRITPLEQVRFLRRFHKERLGVSRRSTRIVKDILVLEQTADHRLSGKTGWVRTERQLGWLVGYLERGRDVYYFATNIDIQRDADAATRLPITKAILGELGLIAG
jgi:beta-lactamase class D